MRRRLVVVALATTTLVVIAFLVPLASLVSKVAKDKALSDAERDSNQVAQVLGVTSDVAQIESIINGGTKAGPERLTVYLAPGLTVPAGRTETPAVKRAREKSESFSAIVKGGQEVIVTVVLGQEGQTATTTEVVSVFVPNRLLRQGVAAAWLVLGLLGMALILVAVVVADQLGRSVVRPVSELAEAARQLGSGDLAARVEPDGPPEIAEVGRSFNRLAGRISDLLAQERELVADLSHRLRTPLTALQLDAEAIHDREMRWRLTEDVAQLQRVVNRIIEEARRPVRTGIGVRTDVASVARERVEFWSALAEDQERGWRLDVAPGEHLVGLPADDIEAAVDALVGNVFSHTDDGVSFWVSVNGQPGKSVVLAVEDDGPGFPSDDVIERGTSKGGSTGLGLDIARRTAESAGGYMLWGNVEGGGARIELVFPIAAME